MRPWCFLCVKDSSFNFHFHAVESWVWPSKDIGVGFLCEKAREKTKTLCRSNTPWSLSHFRKKQSTSQQFIFLIIWCQSRFSPLHHTLLNVDVNCLNLTNSPNLSCLNYFPLREKEKSCTSLMAKDFHFSFLSLLQSRSALFNLGNTVNALRPALKVYSL